RTGHGFESHQVHQKIPFFGTGFFSKPQAWYIITRQRVFFLRLVEIRSLTGLMICNSCGIDVKISLVPRPSRRPPLQNESFFTFSRGVEN
ncbi:MAG: hypothetical protein J5925_00625, partial [Clostridia bacterium]|nr:hypothetical protein [Clostridia bacterium]